MNFNRPTGSRFYQPLWTNLGQFYRQKKIRVYTELILSLLTISFFLFFAIKPTAVIISGLIKKTADQKLVAKKLQAKINALTIARQEYLAVQPDLDLVKQALPQNAQPSELVKQLEALAIRTNVEIKSAQFSKVPLKADTKKSPSKPEEVNFTLNLSGNYSDLKNFLQSLASLRRIVTLKSFTFKTKTGKNEVLVLSLKGQAFYLPSGEEKK